MIEVKEDTIFELETLIVKYNFEGKATTIEEKLTKRTGIKGEKFADLFSD